jgi:hypothetical protein
VYIFGSISDDENSIGRIGKAECLFSGRDIMVRFHLIALVVAFWCVLLGAGWLSIGRNLQEHEMAEVRAGADCQEPIPDAYEYCGVCRTFSGFPYGACHQDGSLGATCVPYSDPQAHHATDCQPAYRMCTGSFMIYLNAGCYNAQAPDPPMDCDYSIRDDVGLAGNFVEQCPI